VLALLPAPDLFLGGRPYLLKLVHGPGRHQPAQRARQHLFENIRFARSVSFAHCREPHSASKIFAVVNLVQQEKISPLLTYAVN
jgi:hypothetical protein